MAALGATDLLVGIDDYSTYPPEIAQLPHVGTFLAPNLEAVMRLTPSLVIIDDVHSSIAAQLADAKIDAVECPMHTLEDVRAGLLRVGDRIGRGDAARAAAADITRAVERAGATKHPGPRPRVLLVIDHEAGGLGNMVAAGPGSWLDELLAIEGAENVLAGSGVRYPKISPEEIIRAAPTVILDASFAADPARARAEWAELKVPAVATGSIAVVKEPYYLAPSPRVTAALAGLDAILYPPQPPGPPTPAP